MSWTETCRLCCPWSQEGEELSDSEDADLAEDEEDFRRYSTRKRSLVQRYSPKPGQAGAFAVGSKRRRSIAEQVQFGLCAVGMQHTGPHYNPQALMIASATLWSVSSLPLLNDIGWIGNMKPLCLASLCSRTAFTAVSLIGSKPASAYYRRRRRRLLRRMQPEGKKRRTTRRLMRAGVDTLSATAARRRSSPMCPARAAACSDGQGARQHLPVTRPMQLPDSTVLLLKIGYRGTSLWPGGSR